MKLFPEDVEFTVIKRMRSTGIYRGQLNYPLQNPPPYPYLSVSISIAGSDYYLSLDFQKEITIDHLLSRY